MFRKSSFWVVFVGFLVLVIVWYSIDGGNTDKSSVQTTGKKNGSALEPGQVLNRAQQEAVLELIRREHEIGDLRQTQKRLQDLHLELLRLRLTCFFSAPEQIRATIDSVLISARCAIDSNIVLTDRLNPIAGFPDYAMAVGLVRKQQQGLIRNYGLVLVAFIRNGCDGLPLREKFGQVL